VACSGVIGVYKITTLILSFPGEHRKMTTVVNVEKFYERLNRIHAHFVKHRYVAVVAATPPLWGCAPTGY
jgi:hypothetical protein